MKNTQAYRLIEVIDEQTHNEFFDLPVQLYRNDKNWSQPLDNDILAILDPERNKLLAEGESQCWILKDESESTVGRIAAFYEKESAVTNEQPTGGVGFFECINDKDAAFMLFDAGKEWLKERGMEAMDGPVSLGMRDSFWGCLVDGFHEPVYNMPYNFPYYRELFEAYGFRDYFRQHTYQRKFEPGGLHPAIRRRADYLLSQPEYHVKMIEKGNKQFAYDFKEVYNKAWAEFNGIKGLSEQEAMELLKTMEPIMDERLVYFAYHKDQPIGFFVMMPDLGQISRRFRGKWNWLTRLRFFYHLKISQSVDRVIGRIFGVIPEFQGKGVEGAMVMAFEKEAMKPSFPYKTLELNWIGDFNPVMMKVAEFIGGKIYKTHITYRYLFDRNKEFKRAPKVNMSKKKPASTPSVKF
ncbi:hypothetical protein [Prolixibacter sp. SD074]|uniref:hypothetical protein n=1 Tax=Prolixibacter sp. SD074 TaxID=2652391 RepID=UPI001281317A|nr:hypothetical protein [Prolixibacter sp. SD074]GET29046.1 hypothetical protein SD074_12480 [Prolixibacter sp. SD074]